MSELSPEEHFGEPKDYILFTRLGAVGLESFAMALVMMDALPTRLLGMGVAAVGALIYADGTRVKDGLHDGESTIVDSE